MMSRLRGKTKGERGWSPTPSLVKSVLHTQTQTSTNPTHPPHTHTASSALKHHNPTHPPHTQTHPHPQTQTSTPPPNTNHRRQPHPLHGALRHGRLLLLARRLPCFGPAATHILPTLPGRAPPRCVHTHTHTHTHVVVVAAAIYWDFGDARNESENRSLGRRRRRRSSGDDVNLIRPVSSHAQ
jgi:hypothetical protein